MKKMRWVSVFLTLSGILFAQNDNVENIMKKYEDNRVSETVNMKAVITITDKFGSTVQEFETWSRKNGDTLIVVTAGPDQGQKILRLENSIYLYFPEAEEVMRLQGSALKDSVMGSDFSYEDLTGENGILANYTGELLGSETIDGRDCYHLLLTAKTKKQLYQKQELWIDKNSFVEVKSIVYSASGKPLSESLSWDFKKIGKYTIAMQGKMTNLLKKNSTTTMAIQSVQMDIPVAESTFSRSNLSW